MYICKNENKLTTLIVGKNAFRRALLSSSPPQNIKI